MFFRQRKASSSDSSAEDRGEQTKRTLELLRELRLIELQTRRLVDQHLAGSYQSIFKGQGVAFAEVRPYEIGDDVRAIDWNVTARTGEPHIKLFTEERELTLMLVVDMSASLDLGTQEADKRHLVARLAATFAFSAIRNNDRVGLLGYSDQVELMVPPRAGRKHVLSVVQKVLTHRPKSRETMHHVPLQYIARLGLSGAVVILISDFISAVEPIEAAPARAESSAGGAGSSSGGASRAQSPFERALKLVRRRNEVIPVRVEDPAEMQLPPLGLVSIEDLESLRGTGLDLFDFSARGVAAYEQRVQAERERFEAAVRRMRLDLLSIRCGEDWQIPMVRFFERRARQVRR